MKQRFCDKCSFWSRDHDLCFHPDTWTKGLGDVFKSPGDPKILNRDHRCRLYDGSPAGKKWWQVWK